MSRKKRLRITTFQGSSKLTPIKRAHKRVETPFLVCPLFFSKGIINSKQLRLC